MTLSATAASDALAARLLACLRGALGDDRIGYADLPTRMQGGAAADVWRFRLAGAPAGLDRPLVLRRLPRGYGAARVVKERMVQNALASQGYPAPRVHLTCADPSILGGAFLVLDLLPGGHLLRARAGAPEMLGKAHAALHGLDAAPVARALGRRSAKPSASRTVQGSPALRTMAIRHPRLRSVVDWLAASRPAEPESLAVCHGDFHPLNVLVEDGRVTGVLDWSNCTVEDPAADVACTMLLIAVPGRRLLAPQASGSEAAWAASRYLDAYRARRALDVGRLDHYRVRRAVIGLADGADGLPLWRRPAIVRGLEDEIRRSTGIALTGP